MSRRKDKRYPESGWILWETMCEKGMTGRRLSELSHVSEVTISKAKTDGLTARTAEKLADALGVFPSYLLGLTDIKDEEDKREFLKKQDDERQALLESLLSMLGYRVQHFTEGDPFVVVGFLDRTNCRLTLEEYARFLNGLMDSVRGSVAAASDLYRKYYLEPRDSMREFFESFGKPTPDRT